MSDCLKMCRRKLYFKPCPVYAKFEQLYFIVTMTSEMHLNAFVSIVQPNTALLDCILVLYLTHTSTVSDILPMSQAIHRALQISASLGTCI